MNQPAGEDPNKIFVAYQTLYVGPSHYDGTAEEKKALIRTLQAFNSIESKNSEIVRVRPSFLLGLFQVWTKTRESAENLPWSVESYERRYEVVELRPNAENTDYVPVKRLEDTAASSRRKGV